MKLIFHFLMALNFIIATPAFAGPGGGTTPFPFGQAPEDLVGMWSNPAYHVTVSIQQIKATNGQSDKLFVVLTQESLLRQGYMYFTGSEYCGVLYSSNGESLPLCLKGRFGLLALQAHQSRLYFTQDRKPLKK